MQHHGLHMSALNKIDMYEMFVCIFILILGIGNILKKLLNLLTAGALTQRKCKYFIQIHTLAQTNIYIRTYNFLFFFMKTTKSLISCLNKS